MKRNTRKMAIAAFFGVVIFVFKALMPTPMDKMFVVVQSLILSLGFLMLGKMGASYVAIVGGFLTALSRVPFAPFSLAFALMYGLIVDAVCNTLKVKTPEGDVRTFRLTVSLGVSTAIVGLVSYIVTAHMFSLIPRNPILEIAILAVGITSGAIGGYLSGIIWRRYLRYQAVD